MADLCLSFRNLARRTWQDMADSHDFGLALGEESITEHLLLALARKHNGRGLHIEAFNKHQEGTSYNGGLRTAADWEFWICDSVGRGIAVRVQAKRLFMKEGRYGGLDGAGKQISDLIQNAGRAIPLYVFYNSISAQQHLSSDLCGLSPIYQKYGLLDDIWGCSISPPSAIPYKNRPKPAEIMPMYPWHYLVCRCDDFSFSGLLPSLPEIVGANIHRLYSLSVDRSVGERPLGEYNFEPTPVAPEWVRILEDGGEPEILPKGVVGVAIIKETTKPKEKR